MKRETGLDCACRAVRYRATDRQRNRPRRHSRGPQRRRGAGVATLHLTVCHDFLVCPREHADEDFFCSIQDRACGAAKTNPQRPPPSSVREAMPSLFVFFLGPKNTPRAQGPVPPTQNTRGCRHKFCIFLFYFYDADGGQWHLACARTSGLDFSLPKAMPMLCVRGPR